MSSSRPVNRPMVVEGSNMADVPGKSTLPRKSAFSCEACRKRKVSGESSRPNSEMISYRAKDKAPSKLPGYTDDV